MTVWLPLTLECRKCHVFHKLFQTIESTRPAGRPSSSPTVAAMTILAPSLGMYFRPACYLLCILRRRPKIFVSIKPLSNNKMLAGSGSSIRNARSCELKSADE